MRRLVGGLLVVVLAAAGVAGGVLLLQSRDDAGVRRDAGPGERVADRCPARAVPVTRDRRRLSRAQIQTALARGNVVIGYAERPSAALLRVQRELSGPFDAEIAAAGQAVILAETGPAEGHEARAWGRRLRVGSRQSAPLRAFADAWLGKGAPEPCPS